MQHENFLTYANYRYFRLSSLLAVVALLGYWLTTPVSGTAYGGTWYGYLLGIVATGIILLHTAYAFKRRRFQTFRDRRSNDRRRLFAGKVTQDDNRRNSDRRRPSAENSLHHGSTLQGWFSAHVHLGLALIVLTTLHTGFRLGWNLHSLAYILLLLVIASGLVGVYGYLHLPRQLLKNGIDGNLEDIIHQITALDEALRTHAAGLPPALQTIVDAACRDTRIGGSLREKLVTAPPGCPTRQATDHVRTFGNSVADSAHAKQIRDLYALLLRKQGLLDKAREHLRLTTLLRAWQALHVPLSVALLAALFAHVISILVFW